MSVAAAAAASALKQSKLQCFFKPKPAEPLASATNLTTATPPPSGAQKEPASDERSAAATDARPKPPMQAELSSAPKAPPTRATAPPLKQTADKDADCNPLATASSAAATKKRKAASTPKAPSNGAARSSKLPAGEQAPKAKPRSQSRAPARSKPSDVADAAGGVPAGGSVSTAVGCAEAAAAAGDASLAEAAPPTGAAAAAAAVAAGAATDETDSVALGEPGAADAAGGTIAAGAGMGGLALPATAAPKAAAPKAAAVKAAAPKPAAKPAAKRLAGAKRPRAAQRAPARRKGGAHSESEASASSSEHDDDDKEDESEGADVWQPRGQPRAKRGRRPAAPDEEAGGEEEEAEEEASAEESGSDSSGDESGSGSDSDSDADWRATKGQRAKRTKERAAAAAHPRLGAHGSALNGPRTAAVELSEYEKARLANIAANEAMLRRLGLLGEGKAAAKAVLAPKPAAPRLPVLRLPKLQPAHAQPLKRSARVRGEEPEALDLDSVRARGGRCAVPSHARPSAHTAACPPFPYRALPRPLIARPPRRAALRCRAAAQGASHGARASTRVPGGRAERRAARCVRRGGGRGVVRRLLRVDARQPLAGERAQRVRADPQAGGRPGRSA